jgi:hypothetical protein
VTGVFAAAGVGHTDRIAVAEGQLVAEGAVSRRAAGQAPGARWARGRRHGTVPGRLPRGVPGRDHAGSGEEAAPDTTRAGPASRPNGAEGTCEGNVSAGAD